MLRPKPKLRRAAVKLRPKPKLLRLPRVRARPLLRLAAVLARSEGSFTYTSGLTAEELALPVIGGFMGLIMEGMRRMDEDAAGRD